MLMSVLDEYIEELKVDTYVDEFNLRDKQMMLPGIKHKWCGRLIRCKIERNKLKRDRYNLLNVLAVEIVKKSHIKLSIPVAMKKAEDLQSVVDMDEKINMCELTVLFLEKTERTLSSMTFDIKNLTEIMKLETQ